MRTKRILLGAALTFLTGLSTGCADKSAGGNANLSGMTKEQQDKAMRGDPSKIPADIRAKYIDKPIVAPVPSPSAAIAAAEAKKAGKP